jgi:alpha-tubulin suppressor-like RCC1 family protein
LFEPSATLRCVFSDHSIMSKLAPVLHALLVGGAAVTAAAATIQNVVAGEAHTCVLLDDGGVMCWGSNTFGQLGYGANITSFGIKAFPYSAGRVALGPLPVVALAAGGYHTCALLVNGSLICWGYSKRGQLGYGNMFDIGDDELPTAAGVVNTGGIFISSVACGATFTCALATNGSVMCWGDNFYGQLGYGHKSIIGDDELPYSAGFVSLGCVAVTIVSSSGAYHTCALTANGSAICWGENAYGQLGYPYASIVDSSLVLFPVPSDAGLILAGAALSDIVVGAGHTCGLFAGNRTVK